MAHPEQPVDELHVSFSQISTYLICPERFRLGYVCGHRPSFRNADEVFGSVMHRVLGWYHASIQRGRRLDLAAMQLELENAMSPERLGPHSVLWNDDESHDALVARGRELLKLYVEEVKVHEVLAVEKRFSMPIQRQHDGEVAEERLVGAIDLIERDEDGRTFITELKTAARAFDRARLAYDLQMSVYGAARRALGYPDAHLRFRVLLKQKAPRIVTYEVQRDEASEGEMTRVVTAILKAIDLGVWYPNRGWQCDGCGHRSRCGS